MSCYDLNKNNSEMNQGSEVKKFIVGDFNQVWMCDSSSAMCDMNHT